MDLPRPLICPVPPAAAISAARARPLYKAPQARTVVIVGAGFSGTAVAIHLLRLPHSAPLRVVVVERSRQLTGSQLAIDEIAFLLGFSEAECLSSCLQALDGSFAPRLPDLGTGTQLPRRLSSAAATKQEPETSPHGEAFRLFRGCSVRRGRLHQSSSGCSNGASVCVPESLAWPRKGRSNAASIVFSSEK